MAKPKTTEEKPVITDTTHPAIPEAAIKFEKFVYSLNHLGRRKQPKKSK